MRRENKNLNNTAGSCKRLIVGSLLCTQHFDTTESVLEAAKCSVSRPGDEDIMPSQTTSPSTGECLDISPEDRVV